MCFLKIDNEKLVKFLVGIRETTHTAHDAENVVVGGVHTNLGGLGTLNSGVGKHKLEGGVVDA